MSQKKSILQSLKGHLHTVHTHRRKVRQHCFACGIYKQGLLHDLSKYSPSEFFQSVKYYQGNRSPYMYQKEVFGYSPGWLHHKGRNKHHWEYWYDMINGQWQAIQMPFNYVVEMACDRVAACQVYLKDQYTQKTPLEYYNARKERYYMHPKTREQLERILQHINDYGEDNTFAQLKVAIQNKQDDIVFEEER